MNFGSPKGLGRTNLEVYSRTSEQFMKYQTSSFPNTAIVLHFRTILNKSILLQVDMIPQFAVVDGGLATELVRQGFHDIDVSWPG